MKARARLAKTHLNGDPLARNSVGAGGRDGVTGGVVWFMMAFARLGRLPAPPPVVSTRFSSRGSSIYWPGKQTYMLLWHAPRSAVPCETSSVVRRFYP